MTEARWFAATDTLGPIMHLHEAGSLGGRKVRLFAVACCGRVYDFLPLHSRDVIDLAAQFIEGCAEEANWEHASDVLWDRYGEPPGAGYLEQPDEMIYLLTYWALAAHWMDAYTGSHQAVLVAGDAYRTGKVLRTEQWFGANDWWEAEARWGMAAEVAAQVALIHDIFGNPFKRHFFLPEWRTEYTFGMALKMYDEREFAAMPILADALEEAGCDNADILAHCREPATHVRGCWVVDLVLGKE